jgi:hypothetical protein
VRPGAERKARQGTGQGRPAGAAGERDRLGPVGEQAGPVSAVPVLPGGTTVGLLVGDQPVHAAEGAGRALLPTRQRPVHLGEPLVEQGHAGAVEDDVMDAQVVHVPAGREREQRVAAQARQVQCHGRGAVPLHPADRLGLRVGMTREIEVRQRHRGVRRRARGAGVAAGGVPRRRRAVRPVRPPLLVGEEAGAEGLRLGQRVMERRRQHTGVERPVDLQAGTGLVVRATGIQLLGQPHLALCGRQPVPNGRELGHLSPHNHPPEPPGILRTAREMWIEV